MLLPQKQPNHFSCFPTAFAIVLGIEVKQLFEEAGHDGSDIIWPSCPEPFNRRGFHIQELIYISRQHGYAVSTYEMKPEMDCGLPGTMGPHPVKTTIPLIGNLAVLGGMNHRNMPHAVAWDGYKIIDPAGGNKFKTEVCFILDWIKD